MKGGATAPAHSKGASHGSESKSRITKWKNREGKGGTDTPQDSPRAAQKQQMASRDAASLRGILTEIELSRGRGKMKERRRATMNINTARDALKLRHEDECIAESRQIARNTAIDERRFQQCPQRRRKSVLGVDTSNKYLI